MKQSLIALLSVSLSFNACAPQKSITNGFTNKAEAQNKIKNGLKEGKWIEYLDKNEVIIADTNAALLYYLTFYKAGSPCGIKREYYKNGKLYSEATFINGKLNGVSKGYYESGGLLFEIPLKDGKQNGVTKMYHENGKLQFETNFIDGKLISSKHYDENGVVIGQQFSPDSNFSKKEKEALEYLHRQTDTNLTSKGKSNKGFTKIGTQIWTTKNLDVTTFRNGDPIYEAKTKEDWESASNAGNPAWCYYAWDSTYGHKYGKLYNGYAVQDSRGLAPQGWHIPSDDEWIILIKYLGGSQLAGNKMKSPSEWSGNNNGNNISGFSALPAGQCFDGTPMNIGETVYFWSTTEYSHNDLMETFLQNGENDLYRSDYGAKTFGHSVRCIKN